MKNSIFRVLPTLLALSLGLALTTGLAPRANAYYPPTGKSLDDAETKTLRDFLESFLITVDHPLSLYHWFNSGGRDPIWSSNFNPQNPAGMDHVKYFSARYWNAFCPSDQASPQPPGCGGSSRDAYGTQNMFGPGLYLATDPASTLTYGARGEGKETGNWALLRVQLPKGLRYYNLLTSWHAAPPIQALFRKMGCADLVQGGDVERELLFRMSQSVRQGYASDICVVTLRKILRDDLQVDGFFYDYDAKGLLGTCTDTVNRTRLHSEAFVLTSANRITADLVRVYQAQSSGEDAERLRIQSLVVQADHEGPRNYLTPYESFMFGLAEGQSVQNASMNGQDVEVELCTQHGTSCTTQTIIARRDPTPPLPTLIPADDANGVLLWKDLVGKPLPTDNAAWAKANLFGCGG